MAHTMGAMDSVALAVAMAVVIGDTEAMDTAATAHLAMADIGRLGFTEKLESLWLR